jgi:hypothetical protein
MLRDICEIWRPLVGLGYVRVDCRIQSAEDQIQIVAGCESRAGLKLTVGGFRRIFHEVGVRVWPVRLVGVEFTWAVDLKYLCPVGLAEVRLVFQLELGD